MAGLEAKTWRDGTPGGTFFGFLRDLGKGALFPVHVKPPHDRVSISGTTVLAGAVKVFRGADINSTFLQLTNPRWKPNGDENTESLWFCDSDRDEDQAEAKGLESFELQPGQTYTWPDGVTNRVTLCAEDDDHPYYGRKA